MLGEPSDKYGGGRFRAVGISYETLGARRVHFRSPGTAGGHICTVQALTYSSERATGTMRRIPWRSSPFSRAWILPMAFASILASIHNHQEPSVRRALCLLCFATRPQDLWQTGIV